MSDRRILLVDDERYVTATLAAKFRAAGFEVTTASDGAEAFSLLTGAVELPHLVLSDLQMPVMNGYELSVALKNHPRTALLPVVLVTARGHYLSDEELAATNIRKVLGKPFSSRQVLAEVDLVLAGKGRDAA